jgi:hypothetical protein
MDNRFDAVNDGAVADFPDDARTERPRRQACASHRSPGASLT